MLRALAPAWHRSSWLTSREPREVCPALISPLREPAWLGYSRGGLALSASRGLDPREGLGCLVDEDGPYGLLAWPCCGPQAVMSRDPRSQNADSSPRAQGALRLGFTAKPRVKFGALRAPKACGLGRRVAVDWTWASPLPHAASATARLDKSLRHARKSIITCDRGKRRLAFSFYKWGGGGALVAHLFLACLLLCSIACSAIDGATKEVLCHRERKGPSRGPWIPGAQARPRPSAQACRDPRCGPPSRWHRGTRRGSSRPWWFTR